MKNSLNLHVLDFVRDEEGEMARRCIKFDMNELARIATQVVGSKSCQCPEIPRWDVQQGVFVNHGQQKTSCRKSSESKRGLGPFHYSKRSWNYGLCK
jgi:hypothetical protein